MSKKFWTLLVIVSLLSLATVAAAPARGRPPPRPPANVTVVVDGSRFYQDGTEGSQKARLHDALVYPCDGGDPVYYYAWPHPDETWTDMGFPILRVEYSWHRGSAGGPDHFGVADGACPTAYGVKVSYGYVYESEIGFSEGPNGGIHNTCTLISELGVPSVERIATLCGSVPEDINLTCAADVIDNGTDQGHFICDIALAEWGERRLYLFSDPWEDTDLIDVILRHQARK